MAHYNAPLGAEMTTDIDNYLSFVLTMFLAFGVTFEVPIVVVLLVRMDVRDDQEAARRSGRM